MSKYPQLKDPGIVAFLEEGEKLYPEDAVNFTIALPSWFFTALLFVLGIAFACGMASTFKYIGDEFPVSMGAVSGIVGPDRIAIKQYKNRKRE